MTMKLALATGSALLILAMGAAVAQGAGRHGGGRDMLAQADANGDGQISLAELTAVRAEAFARMDQNGDGQISGGELRGRMAEAPEASDGVVTEAEFIERAPPVMERFDANGDNVLDQAELQAAHEARRDRQGRRGGGRQGQQPQG